MIATITSATIIGLDAYPIQTEIDVAKGMLLSVNIVGLPDTAVRESRERVISAIKQANFHFPHARITINLAPAHLKKEGSGFDLPIALGILAASGQLSPETLSDYLIAGELSLDGQIRPIRGGISMALLARQLHKKRILLPEKNADEVAIIPRVSAIPARSLTETVRILQSHIQARPAVRKPTIAQRRMPSDFCHIKGQYHAKRALEIAAAGFHHTLLIGPPGSGKTFLAKSFPSLLPNLSDEAALETSKIYSLFPEQASKGTLPRDIFLNREPPFRAPHHTTSYATLLGRRNTQLAGEITLAHHGVMYLDELGEFRRDALEALRQPLEEGSITLSQTNRTVRYPARFLLLASTNPCPCGYYTDPSKVCICTPHSLQRYWAKLSGPLLDRIDLHIQVPRLSPEELLTKTTGESSEAIRERVEQARARQAKRFPQKRDPWNAHLTTKELLSCVSLSTRCETILGQAIEKFKLSARAYHRILKVSRTIADLARSDPIDPPHLLEAIQYRTLSVVAPPSQ